MSSDVTTRNDVAARTPRLALILLVATCLASPYVLFSAFSNVAWFDDEGTLLMWFRSLRDGYRMYDDIYNLYGPLYSAVYGFLYAVLHVPLTHTDGRLIAATLWLSYTACCAVFCYQLTRSLAASAMCYVLVLIWLTPLMDSPGHPEELCVLLLAVALLCIGSIERRANVAALIGIGAAIAGLSLMKINIGAFVGAGGLLVLLAVTARSGLVRIATYAAALGLLALPAAITALLFDLDWVRLYCLFSTMTTVAALLVFMTARPRPGLRLADWWIIVLGGLVIGVVAIGGMMLAGSSLHAIFDAVILQNARYVRNWYIPMRVNPIGLGSAAVSLVAAILYVICGRRLAWRTYREAGILGLKSAFVLLGFCLLTAPVLAFLILTPFCWVIMAMPEGSSRHGIAARGATALVGAAMASYAFPIAGHQVNIAALVPIAMIPVLIQDVILTLQRRDNTARRSHWFPVILFCIAAVLGVMSTTRAAIAWSRGVALNLPGTAFIRVSQDQAEELRWVTDQLAACSFSYTLPGLFSFAFWTGHFPPTVTNVNLTLNFVMDPQQEQIIDALKREPDLCILYNPEFLAFFNRGQIERHPPLLRYIESDFVPSAERGGYAILRRRPSD